MTWRVDPHSGSTAEHMLIRLADACNGACTWDNSGFSKIDTALGHSLAQRARQGHAWSVKQATAALKLLRRYQRQLGGKDFMDTWLQEPTFARAPLEPQAAAKPLRKLFSADKTAVFEFAYDAAIVQAIKQIRGTHRGTAWRSIYNPQTRTWSVPVHEGSIELIMQVATAHEFDIEQRFVDYQQRVQQRRRSVQESMQEGHMLLALNDGINVTVAHDAIVIAVENPEILAEFQQALGV
jgi:hypothetical protein